MMYRKVSLFPKWSSSYETAKRILRSLCTAVQRLDFGIPNEHRIKDSSHISGGINPRDVTGTVVVPTQSQGQSKKNVNSNST